MSAKPRIGITTSLYEGEQRLDLRYIHAVERAGGSPVIVPMFVNAQSAAEFANSIDGLVVTGGPAVTDGLIGSLPSDINETEALRVESDKRVLGAFLEASRPVLGICYGMQLANALLGGQIYADVETQRDGTDVHSQKRGGTTHSVLVETDTMLFDVLQDVQIEVNTRHIQAIATLGKSLIASGLAPDGVIEAIESSNRTFLGVQFHPERMGTVGRPFFSDLINRASSQ